jgi:hypothetical protein
MRCMAIIIQAKLPLGKFGLFYWESRLEMKRILMLACFLSFFFIGTVNAYQETFFDDFNDGNTDGWWLSEKGQWSIENDTLKQDKDGEDHVLGLVENLIISDQVIETEVYTPGYGGIALWYQDKFNYIDILIYPFSSGIYLVERFDGEVKKYQYGFTTRHYTWYDLRIEADSKTGELDIYIDGTYIFTYQTTTTKREGLSGVSSGNGGANFDDFTLTYQVCDADYNGDGNINFLDSFQKRKDLIEDALQKAIKEFNEWKENCYLPSKDEQ